MSQPSIASIKSANGPEDHCLNILSSVSLSDNEKLSLVIGDSLLTFKKHTVCFLSPWISDILKDEYSCLKGHVFISLPEEASMRGFQSLKAIIETGVAHNLSNGDKEELSSAIHLLGMDIQLNEVVRQNIDHEANDEGREAPSFDHENLEIHIKIELEESQGEHGQDKLCSNAEDVMNPGSTNDELNTMSQESENDDKESFIKTETVEKDHLGSENNRNEETYSGIVRESSEGEDCRDTENNSFNQGPDLICYLSSNWTDQYAQEDVHSDIEDGQDDGETIALQSGNNQLNLIEDLNDENAIDTLSSDEIFSKELESKSNAKKSIVKFSFVSEPKLLIKDYIRKPDDTTPIIDKDFQKPEDDLFKKLDNVEECPICERRQRTSCSVYGASSCNNCRIFFLRTVRRSRLNLKLEMCQSSSSNICNLKKNRACMPCRYNKCLSLGMKENLVKTDKEIKDKYFINGATEKVAKGPKEARSWNKLKKSLGKVKPKETTKEKKKTGEEDSDYRRREKRSRERDNGAPRKKQKKEQDERQPKKDSSAKKNPCHRGKGKKRDEDKS